MPRLDLHDELGMPWDEFADGRVYRLVRGRDFTRNVDRVEEAAENAARRLGRVVRTFQELRHGSLYFWVQFVDYEVMLGETCPCGSEELRRVDLNFAECAACKATVALLKPKKEKADDEPFGAEDEALLQSLFAGGTTAGLPLRRSGARNGRPARPSQEPAIDPRDDLTRLGAFTKVALFLDGRDERRERLFGQALGSDDQAYLVVVECPLRDGERIANASYPAGWVHTVWCVPVDPFGNLIRLERLYDREPDVRIDDPLSPPPEPAEGGPPAEAIAPPPERLAGFEDVRLFRYGSREAKKRESFFGYGRTPDGEAVLLTVRYRTRDGERLMDPAHPGEPLHTVRSAPFAPFGAVVDTDALFSLEESRDGDDETESTAGDPEATAATEEASPGSEAAPVPAGTEAPLAADAAPKDRTDKRERKKSSQRQERAKAEAQETTPSASQGAATAGAPRAAHAAVEAPSDRAEPQGAAGEVEPTQVAVEPAAKEPGGESVVAPPPGLPAGPAEPDPSTLDETKLGAFKNVDLFFYGREESRETFYGHALYRDDHPCLLLVDYALRDGSRIEAPGYPGGWAHAIRSIPAEPFGHLVDLEALRSLEPSTRIAEPLSTVASAAADEGSTPVLAPSPAGLTSFKDVHLFVCEQEGDESFFGYGHAPGGETALMTVRVPPAQIIGPEAVRPLPEPSVRWVPLAPFIRIVDLSGLFGKQPDLVVG